jgi:hypothetical protein
MKVIFKYSPKIEQEMIDYFEDQKKQGNEFSFVKLPSKGKVSKINKKYLSNKENQIKSKWKKIEEDFFVIVKNMGLAMDDKYLCYFTRYGSCGFYMPPNSFVIRIANKKDIEESNINISHELMHLILKKNNKDQNLGYEGREMLVDKFLMKKLFKKILPEYEKQDFS